MKKTFLFLFVTTATLTLAQNRLTEMPYSIGIKFLGAQTWSGGTMEKIIGGPNDLELEIQSVFSQAVGMQFIYHFHPRFAAESGLFYSNPAYKSEKARYTKIIGDSTHFGLQKGYMIYFINLKSLHVPLKARYKIPLDRFSFFATAGPGLHFILESERVDHFEDDEGELLSEESRQSLPVNDVFISLDLSIGLDYRFSESLLFSFEPEYHHGLTNLYKKGGMIDESYQPGHKLRSLGVSLGIRYILTRNP